MESGATRQSANGQELDATAIIPLTGTAVPHAAQSVDDLADRVQRDASRISRTDRNSLLVLLFVSPCVLLVGVAAAVLSDLAESENVRTAANVLFSIIFSAVLAFVPRGAPPPEPYSATRAVLVEISRYSAVVCGILGATFAYAADNGDRIACGMASLATFLAFVYSRLDDKKKHSWPCCKISWDLVWWAIACAYSAGLGVAVQPGITTQLLVDTSSALWPALYNTLIPSTFLIVDILLSMIEHGSWNSCLAQCGLMLSVANLVADVAVVIYVNVHLRAADHPPMPLNVALFVSAWLGSAGLPLALAILSIGYFFALPGAGDGHGNSSSSISSSAVHGASTSPSSLSAPAAIISAAAARGAAARTAAFAVPLTSASRADAHGASNSGTSAAAARESCNERAEGRADAGAGVGFPHRRGKDRTDSVSERCDHSALSA